MHIEFSTDRHIHGHEALAAHVQGVVAHALSHVSTHVTRVEVHASDTNADKGGPLDKRCTMEARIEGRQPTVVTDQAATLEQAIIGAAGKLRRAVESVVERRQDQR
ncbi:MAG: HPF/RaiA family ribosome-associated protein [Acetobacteraceae bacterium]|nr:HPF/RaiA family ribosome-associated protein [Acetobacteraceae bacterium]